MAIMQECPLCHRKQSVKKKKCTCGANLDKLKGQKKKVRYWISYYIIDPETRKKKQERKYVGTFEDLDGYSIEDARIAEAKKKVQKKENRLLDILLEAKMTFDELSKWYLEQRKVKKLKSYDRIKLALDNFNAIFGQTIVKDIRQTDLEEYQESRLDQNKAPATVDMEIKYAQAAVTKAFDNDLFSGDALKAFRRTKKLLKPGSNARKQTVSFEQYSKLVVSAPNHYKAVLILAFNTGMRLSEIKGLRWKHIDSENQMIRLFDEDTKEHRSKDIPINHHVKACLESLPRALKHDFVITYRGNPMDGLNSLKRRFPKLCDKAGIVHGRKNQGGITFHDIRRTVKTNMLRAEVGKSYRDLILGHKLTGMDAHYITATDKDLTRALDKYTAWIDEKLKNLNSDQSSDQMG